VGVDSCAGDIIAAAEVLWLVSWLSMRRLMLLTMRDCGWFVRTWKTAPALESNWIKCESSGVTLSTLVRSAMGMAISGRLDCDLPSDIASIARLVLEADVLFHTDRNAMLPEY
jgi:hypothetical protein